MKRIIYTALLLIWATISYTQVTISGQVYDENEPLIGANVYIVGTYSGATTDLDGRYSFVSSEQDSQIIKVEYMGYTSIEEMVVINGNNIALDFVLKEAFNKLKAVTITAGAFEAGDKKKTVVLNSIDMATTAGALGDVAGALMTLPGTTTVGESGKLFVRGGESDETKTFVDGTQVFKPYNSSAPNLSTRGRFNPFMFDGTVFSTGGYSAEYGQALSSVLLLNTKGFQDKDQLNISLMTVGADIAGTKLWDNKAITAKVGYTDLTPYTGLVPQNDKWPSAPRMGEASISYRQKTKKQGLLKVYGAYNKSFFEVNQDNINRPDVQDEFALDNDNLFTNIHWKGLLNDKWSMQLGGSYTYDKDDILVNSQSIIKELKGTHLKSKLNYYAHDKITLKMGAEVYNQDFNQRYSDEEINANDSYNDTRTGLFVEGDFYVSSRLVFRAGLRHAYSSLNNQISLQPRLSTAYKFSKTSQVSMAYGRFLQNSKDDFLIYAPNLKQEEAQHFLLNYQFDKKKRSLRAEVYYKKYDNLVKTKDGLVYDANNYNNNGDGYASGFDIFFRDKRTIKNGDYWVSYSYIDSKRNYRSNTESQTPHFVSKHNLSVVYKHWLPKMKSFVSSTFQIASPRQYTDPNYPGVNNAKLLPYKSFNVSWTYLHRQNLIFYASVKNITGFKNEFGYTFADAPNDMGQYAKQQIQPSAPRFFFVGCFLTLSKDKTLNQLDKIDL